MAGMPDFGDLGGSGNAAEIARLATENAELKQRCNDKEAENAAMMEKFREMEMQKGEVTELNKRIKDLENIITRQRGEIEDYKKKYNGALDEITNDLKPMDDLIHSYQAALKKMGEIDKYAKEMEAYKAQLKKTAEQGDGSRVGIKDILSVFFVGLLLYGFSYFGTKHGSPAATLEQLNDMTWRVIYNQVYVPLGAKPITPYTARDEATKIINNQFHYEQELQRQQAQEQEE